MIKIKLLFVSIFFTTFSYSQWETKYYVDEFGDKTDQKYELIVATGTFSNSATLNSKATYSFIKDDESLIINVFEYGNKLASEIESTFESVKIKQPNGDVITIEKVFFTKTGKLYFNDSKFLQIIDAIKEKGSYIMIFNRTGKYSNSNYKINFKINN